MNKDVPIMELEERVASTNAIQEAVWRMDLAIELMTDYDKYVDLLIGVGEEAAENWFNRFKDFKIPSGQYSGCWALTNIRTVYDRKMYKKTMEGSQDVLSASGPEQASGGVLPQDSGGVSGVADVVQQDQRKKKRSAVLDIPSGATIARRVRADRQRVRREFALLVSRRGKTGRHA